MMSDEKCLEIIADYKLLLEANRAEAREISHNCHINPLSEIDRVNILDHLAYMLPKMEGYIKVGRREKFFRWLGFMQGTLWSYGYFSLNQLRNHNCSDNKPETQ